MIDGAGLTAWKRWTEYVYLIPFATGTHSPTQTQHSACDFHKGFKESVREEQAVSYVNTAASKSAEHFECTPMTH